MINDIRFYPTRSYSQFAIRPVEPVARRQPHAGDNRCLDLRKPCPKESEHPPETHHHFRDCMAMFLRQANSTTFDADLIGLDRWEPNRQMTQSDQMYWRSR
jgi:hypothetical protein